MIKKIQQIVDELSTDEKLQGPLHSLGCKNQRERLKSICELSLQNFEGNILEIGCHIGLTTKIYCELARKYNRKVVVVDPWNGQQQGDQNIYEQFLTNTKEYEDVLLIHRVSSFAPEGKNIITKGEFAFCWIDGLHTYDACKQDIESCSKQKGILAVDDLRWLPPLLKLFNEKRDLYSFESYYNSNCREGYYLT